MAINSVKPNGSKLDLELTTTLKLCKSVNTPRSIAVFMLLDNAQYEDYLNLELTADNYLENQHNKFADDYLVTSVLAKSINLPLNIDRKAVSLAKFREAEEMCKATNLRLSCLTSHEEPSFVNEVRRMIGRILGPLNSNALNFIEKSMKFGPGATTVTRGKGTCLSENFDSRIELTQELYPYARSIMGEQWSNSIKEFDIVPGSKFTTVSKNAKTDRGICTEPPLNMFCQLGVGAFIRKRLRIFGLDLKKGQSLNGQLAGLAKKLNLCTIDLSMASDTIAYQVIKLLIADDWFKLLCTFRSPCCFVDGEFISLEKFSSMGNGFTFELETLVFYSIVLISCDTDRWHHVATYGDDIICPQEHSGEVIKNLEFLGFSVNNDKSFLAGNFFESCGQDYFNGIDVRPFFLRQKKKSHLPYPLQIANLIRLYSHSRGAGFYCDAKFKSVWLDTFKLIPKFWKVRVPAIFGDQGVISSRIEYESVNGPCANQRLTDGLEGFKIKILLASPVKHYNSTFSVLMMKLFEAKNLTQTNLNLDLGHVQRDFYRNKEVVRGFLGLPRTKTSTYLEWTVGFEWHTVSLSSDTRLTP
jgi:hypothetical protein